MSPALQTLFALYPQDSLALVGGYVRAHLRNEVTAATEADLTTLLPPSESAALLKKAGYLTDSPGLKWGTVTAKIGADTFEITSTRTDTYTGTRYPTVTFRASWEEDAARRDVTINAIYLFAGGTTLDPYNGIPDLQNNLVRFIGNPALRLAEDPLRLLRFARFCALYGLSGWTPELNNTFPQALPALATVTVTKKQKELARLQGPHTAGVKSRLAHLGLAI